MEGSEQGAASKAVQLEYEYGGLFKEISHTVHPSGLPGEIRGKASNVSWAVRHSRGNSRTVVTVMDVDNTVAADYFLAVGHYFAERDGEVFVPGCVFDRNSNDGLFFIIQCHF